MATYEININVNGEVEESGAGVSSAGSSMKGSEKSGKGTALATYITTQTIEPFIKQAINFTTSNVELVTGSTELQQKTDLIMNGVQTGVSAFKNASAGAAITSSLGLGGGLGIGIGIALTGIGILMDTFFKQQQINLKAQVEDRQIQYLQNRAGPAFNQSRRGI